MSELDQAKIHLYDLLICLTNAGDLNSPELSKHHQQVAYLAFRIADQMKLPAEQKKELMLAGLTHDAGALSLEERLSLIGEETPAFQEHASRGARLLEGFAPLAGAAEIIRYHHIPWNNGEGRAVCGEEVSPLSHILHLADRVAVSIDRNKDVIGQMKHIRGKILKLKSSVFMPAAADAFLNISAQEYLWLDMVYEPLLYILPDIAMLDSMELDLDELTELTPIFANIIDFRNPFTATHSSGVAGAAEKLAELMGFSKSESKMMLAAGHLHDLGKLAVSPRILEKPGALDADELNRMRSHTFYTYRLLQAIRGFETINQWASFHHERLNGNGYPFHLNENSLSPGSRIMAVADIFTAVMEDRPYRNGMSPDQAALVLNTMVREHAVCPSVVSILTENFGAVNAARMKAQEASSARYRYVMNPL